MFLTILWVVFLVDPPAPYVTDTNLGFIGASCSIDCQSLASNFGVFGGKNSNEMLLIMVSWDYFVFMPAGNHFWIVSILISSQVRESNLNTRILSLVACCFMEKWFARCSLFRVQGIDLRLPEFMLVNSMFTIPSLRACNNLSVFTFEKLFL